MQRRTNIMDMDPTIFHAFRDELTKLSSVSDVTDAARKAAESGAVKVKVPLKPLGYMGAGALATLGAQRAFKDWQTGREVRKAQSERGY